VGRRSIGEEESRTVSGETLMTTTEEYAWSEDRAYLREHAEQLIRDGSAVTIGSGPLGIDTLELLYRRASNPDFAADALKLLHELQTHQVELELLLEQLKDSQAELSGELAHYQALYRLAPVAYLVVSRDGRVTESNYAAAALFGSVPERSGEQTLTQYLAPRGRAAVATMMETLQVPGATRRCVASLADRAGCQLAVTASLTPSGDTVMMTVSEIPTSDADTASP
jgi:PAS domain S-box-containing protein